MRLPSRVPFFYSQRWIRGPVPPATRGEHICQCSGAGLVPSLPPGRHSSAAVRRAARLIAGADTALVRCNFAAAVCSGTGNSNSLNRTRLPCAAGHNGPPGMPELYGPYDDPTRTNCADPPTCPRTTVRKLDADEPARRDRCSVPGPFSSSTAVVPAHRDRLPLLAVLVIVLAERARGRARPSAPCVPPQDLYLRLFALLILLVAAALALRSGPSRSSPAERARPMSRCDRPDRLTGKARTPGETLTMAGVAAREVRVSRLHRAIRGFPPGGVWLLRIAPTRSVQLA